MSRPLRHVITYGTFDMFHVGHLRLLMRARELGTSLTVGVSTDAFNAIKGKTSHYTFAERAEHVAQARCVDSVLPEHGWDQKHEDIERLGISILVMGSDWQGEFDHLADLCEVVYLPRTAGVSSTIIRGFDP